MVISKLLPFILISIAISTSSIYGEEKTENDALSIESKAHYFSADILIKEANGEPVSDEDKDNDKKREKLGIGEKAMLTLCGKPALIGDITQLQWNIEEGQHLATIEPIPGSLLANLTIRSDLKQNHEQAHTPSTVKVSVSTSANGYKSKSSEIVFPSNMTAKHVKNGNKNGTIITDAEYNMPQDGDTNVAGASAKLEVTIEPTYVSFRGIRIKEKEEGFINSYKPSLATQHKIKDRMYSPFPKNIFTDKIGSKRTLAEIRNGNHLLDQSWGWKCMWHTCNDQKEPQHIITTVEQSFSYQQIQDPKLGQAVKVSISKFGRYVMRSTFPGNEHDFH